MHIIYKILFLYYQLNYKDLTNDILYIKNNIKSPFISIISDYIGIISFLLTLITFILVLRFTRVHKNKNALRRIISNLSLFNDKIKNNEKNKLPSDYLSRIRNDLDKIKDYKGILINKNLKKYIKAISSISKNEKDDDKIISIISSNLEFIINEIED